MGVCVSVPNTLTTEDRLAMTETWITYFKAAHPDIRKGVLYYLNSMYFLHDGQLWCYTDDDERIKVIDRRNNKVVGMIRLVGNQSIVDASTILRNEGLVSMRESSLSAQTLS